MEIQVGDLFQNTNGVGYEVIGIVKNHPNYPQGLIEVVKLGDYIPYYLTPELITANLTKLS